MSGLLRGGLWGGVMDETLGCKVVSLVSAGAGMTQSDSIRAVTSLLL